MDTVCELAPLGSCAAMLAALVWLYHAPCEGPSAWRRGAVLALAFASLVPACLISDPARAERRARHFHECPRCLYFEVKRGATRCPKCRADFEAQPYVERNP